MRPEPLSKRKVKQLKPHEAIRAVAQAQRGNESSDDEFYQEQVADSLSRWQERKRPKPDPHLLKVALRLSLETGAPSTLTDEEYESRIAFCCKVCHCPRTVKAQYVGKEYIQASSELLLWHRRCCHTNDNHDETWASPYLCAVQEVQEDLFTPPCTRCQSSQGTCMPCRIEQMQRQGIQRVDPMDTLSKYQQNVKEENEIIGEDFHEVINDRLRTNPIYAAHEKKFRWLRAKVKQQGQPKAAVVVDLFGGIGSAVVVLKRLKIAMTKIIHVEHDKVANYVYKYWNCSKNNKDKDGIEHVFISSFETFEHRLTRLMEEHGPFDIVVGGPPCVDYTKINAGRAGVDGIQGSYLPRMGDVISRIKAYNKTKHCNFFFLAENAVLSNGKEKPLDAGDLQTVLKAFGVDWHVTLDSRDHTPLRRKRTYVTNIPMVEDLTMLDPPPSLCFDDGYDVAGMIFDPESGLSKAAGLMANKLRLDDHPRMSIYKEYGKRQLKFFRRTPNVAERERLMGFPPNYVSKPLKKLFSSLVYGGFAPESVEINKHWEDCLAKEFHEFAGDHHFFRGRWPPFQFYSAPTSDTDQTPEVKLELAPPLATQKPQYYTEEQYAKRLIGNAFSIPTVEFLLQPIKPFFAQREYKNFDYVYAWTGWDPTSDDDIVRSTRVKALMREMARTENEKTPFSARSHEYDHDKLSNRKAPPPNPIAAARARQSTGKIFLPPAKAMNDIERYRLSAGNDVQKDDDDNDDEKGGIYDV